MRSQEFILEARNSLFAFVKQHFPTWPDYVLKDFLYAQAKGIRDQAELDDFLKRNKQDFGNCKWTLTKLPITFDIFTPKTQRMLASREGGSSNPFQVPRDAERHAQQSQMIQQKGVSAEPIIVAKLSNGYDLIEGWHRTIQHLKEFPQGYTGPAWVCTGAAYKSESVEQGVAEGLEHADKLSGLVDLPVFPSSTNPSGTAKVVNTGDRIMAVLNVRGVNIPYYISTGGGGKASVPTGKWYPIFGRHSSGWLNKGGEDSINKSYGSNVLALGSSRLNNMLGDLSSMESQIPFMKKSGDAIINRDLQPMSYSEVSANPDEFKKRVNSFLAKLGSPPFYKVNVTETQAVAEDN